MRKKLLILSFSCCVLLAITCSRLDYKGFMTWEEYYSQSRLDPYVLELKTGKGDLLYYGVFHTVSSKDRQIMEIERNWDRFKPTIALSEGGVWPVVTSKKEAIRMYGEQGLLSYLAARDRITVKSIEPGITREAFHLLKKFSPPRIKMFYVLRQAAIHRMMKKDVQDTSYVEHILRKLSKFTPLLRVSPRTLAEFEELVPNFLPAVEDWRKVPFAWFCSYGKGMWTNRMCQEVNDYRNRRMVKMLLREIKKNHRVFAVAGRSHVVMQEPALLSALRKYNSYRVQP